MPWSTRATRDKARADSSDQLLTRATRNRDKARADFSDPGEGPGSLRLGRPQTQLPAQALTRILNLKALANRDLGDPRTGPG